MGGLRGSSVGEGDPRSYPRTGRGTTDRAWRSSLEASGGAPRRPAATALCPPLQPARLTQPPRRGLLGGMADEDAFRAAMLPPRRWAVPRRRAARAATK